MPEGATPFRVLIVDDHPLMRHLAKAKRLGTVYDKGILLATDGISQLLQLDPAFNVVAGSGRWRQVIIYCYRHH